MRAIQGDLCHEQLLETIQQTLAYDEKSDYNEWKAAVKEKAIELLGMKEIEKNACPLNMEIESEEQKDGYRQIRFSFYSEVGAVVTCYLLLPDLKKDKYPVVITLQGHSTGFHNSIGVVKYDEDKPYQPRGQFAVQSVKEGYATLAIEQRGMGERAAKNGDFRRVHLGDRGGCYYEAVTASLLGRTILGERCWDISRAIDVLANFS
jgi:cephalosporin-C deacetylase-like acetyl esterase